jgi:protein SCO1/2
LREKTTPAEEGAGVNRRNGWNLRLLVVLAVLGWLIPALSQAGKGETLPRIGAAPEFTLTTQDGQRFSLRDLHGKVVAVTFIYTSCADTCPLLTAKMVRLQSRFGADFGTRVFFVAVTVDPERDTPEVLKRYAQAHSADLAGWAFLTGTAVEIRQVTRRYGIYVKKTPLGEVDHTFLTSLIDPSGTLRVQYLGVRFDPEELLRDLQSLLQEGDRQ